MSDPLEDAAGVAHEPAHGETRIVSLVPSITELLFDLGLGAQIVGRTHYCIHPTEKVKTVPSLGGTKKIRLDRLAALKPTHVIVNIDENTEAMAAAIGELGPELIVTHPLAPEDNLGLYRVLGGVFGRAAEAEELSARFGEVLAALREAAQDWATRKVLYLIWRDPWMTISRDTYISRTLALVHWETVADPSDERYPGIDMTDELVGAIDIALFSTEPYLFTDHDVETFRATYPESEVRSSLIDGEMVSWYGSRAITGLDYLRHFAEAMRETTTND